MRESLKWTHKLQLQGVGKFSGAYYGSIWTHIKQSLGLMCGHNCAKLPWVFALPARSWLATQATDRTSTAWMPSKLYAVMGNV